jgi:anti-sigma factor RsiW
MIGVFRSRNPISCQELVELVTDYLDGALSRSDRSRFEAHIGECEHCSAYLVQMQLTIEATGRLTEESIDPQARDELLAAFRDWKRGRGAPA